MRVPSSSMKLVAIQASSSMVNLDWNEHLNSTHEVADAVLSLKIVESMNSNQIIRKRDFVQAVGESILE